MYLDSCIIVKLLVPEPDSQVFLDGLRGALLSSSELAWTEVAAALMSKERAGAISPAKRHSAWRIFIERVESREFLLHPLDGANLRKANHILESCHPQVSLRTLDAIHAAACDLSQDFPLCSTDRRMRDAARLLHIPVFPEEETA